MVHNLLFVDGKGAIILFHTHLDLDPLATISTIFDSNITSNDHTNPPINSLPYSQSILKSCINLWSFLNLIWSFAMVDSIGNIISPCLLRWFLISCQYLQCQQKQSESLADLFRKRSALTRTLNKVTPHWLQESIEGRHIRSDRKRRYKY